MEIEAIRAMARTICGTDRPRSAELRSWVNKGVMSASQLARVGRSDKPPCFKDEEQWLAWCIHEASRPLGNTSSYCNDCTKSYQTLMLRNKRCEFPLTMFSSHGVSGVSVGRRHISKRQPRRRPTTGGSKPT